MRELANRCGAAAEAEQAKALERCMAAAKLDMQAAIAKTRERCAKDADKRHAEEMGVLSTRLEESARSHAVEVERVRRELTEVSDAQGGAQKPSTGVVTQYPMLPSPRCCLALRWPHPSALTVPTLEPSRVQSALTRQNAITHAKWRGCAPNVPRKRSGCSRAS